MLLRAIVLVTVTLVSLVEVELTNAESSDIGLPQEFGELGCNNDPDCLNLAQTAGLELKNWYIKWGWTYKGLKEVPATSIKECAEQCVDSELCFVTSWADNKCYLQDEGVSELNSENLEAHNGAITFLTRIKQIMEFSEFGKLLEEGSSEEDDGLPATFGDENEIDSGEDIPEPEIEDENEIDSGEDIPEPEIEVSQGNGKRGRGKKSGNKKVSRGNGKRGRGKKSGNKKGRQGNKVSRKKRGRGNRKKSGNKKRRRRRSRGHRRKSGNKKGRRGHRRKFGHKRDEKGSSEEGEPDDTLPATFGDFGCQNNQRCSDLVKLARISRKTWFILLGNKYKGSKEVPANDIKECVDTCMNSDNCFVVSWTEDNKCHVQDDGVTDLTPDNLEPSTNEVMFLGRLKRLTRFRKFKKLFESEVLSPGREIASIEGGVTSSGGPADEYVSPEKDQTAVYSNIIIQGKEVRVCVVTWEGANYLDKAMEPLEKATTDEDCISFCIKSNNCTANSFRPNSDPKCWILNGDFRLSGKDLVANEEDSISIKQNCDDADLQSSEWETQSCNVLQININYVDESMVPVKQSTSDDCQKFCEDSEECKASSFRPKTEEKCWVFNSDKFASSDKTEIVEGVSTYMKVDCATASEVKKWKFKVEH